MALENELIHLGGFDEPHVQELAESWLLQRGVIPCLARNSVTLNYWEPNQPVVLYMGAPWILMTNDVLMPYAEAVYHLYRDHYKPIILADASASAVPNLYWPKLPRIAEDFDGYLKAIEKGYARSLATRHPELEELAAPRTLVEYCSTLKTKYRPHFYGAPSKRVEWRVVMGGDPEVAPLLAETMEMAKVHAYKVLARVKTPTKDFGDEVIHRTWMEKQYVPNMFLTVGTDMETGSTVGIMLNYVYEESKTIDCDLIAINHDEKYRGDSLVTCAILTAARQAFTYGEGWECNYGMVPLDIGLYKGAFSELEPVMGIEVIREA